MNKYMGMSLLWYVGALLVLMLSDLDNDVVVALIMTLIGTVWSVVACLVKDGAVAEHGSTLSE